MVPLQRRAGEHGEAELSFEFRKMRFCYEAEQAAFHKLKYPTQARLGTDRGRNTKRMLSSEVESGNAKPSLPALDVV